MFPLHAAIVAPFRHLGVMAAMAAALVLVVEILVAWAAVAAATRAFATANP